MLFVKGDRITMEEVTVNDLLRDQDETVIGVTCTRKEQNGDRLTVEVCQSICVD